MIAVYATVEPSTFATNGTFQTIFGSQAALVFLSMAFLCTIIVGEFVALTNVGHWPFGGLPISFYYGIALALVFAYVLAFTPLGRHMQFVGANREVSRLAGVRVNSIRFGAFVAAGALCGIGGVVISAGL